MFLGNSLSLAVLLLYQTSLQMKPSYHRLITALVLWDLLYVILAFLLYSLNTLSPVTSGREIFPRIIPLLYPLTQVS